jgi:hypothetical protein
MESPMHGLIRFIVVAAAAAVTLLVVPAAGEAARPPALGWSPATSGGSYNFGTFDAGARRSVVFTLTNPGGSATGRLAVTLSGSAAFSITADGCSGRSVGPRRSCAVTVRYAAAAAGRSDRATLAASGKKPAARASLALTGASALLGPPESDLRVSPGRCVVEQTGLIECVVVFASPHTNQTFTVTNVGSVISGPLSVEGGGEGFALANDRCSGRPLLPTLSCTFDFNFNAPAGCSPGQNRFGSVDISGATLPLHLDAQGPCSSASRAARAQVRRHSGGRRGSTRHTRPSLGRVAAHLAGIRARHS